MAVPSQEGMEMHSASTTSEQHKALSCEDLQMAKSEQHRTWIVEGVLLSVVCHPTTATTCATAERLQIRCQFCAAPPVGVTGLQQAPGCLCF